MGAWSRLVGDIFLDWLAPAPGLRWLDVGCGNGAFTEMIVDRAAPAAVDGVDPAEGQLAFARTRPAARLARFHQGDAMSLPFPEPAVGVAEMARVVRPGGVVAAYGWDMPGGGFPYQSLQDEMRALGVPVSQPPSRDASRIDVMQRLWTGADLRDVETRAISVTRTYESFDDYWTIILRGPS